MTTYFYNCAFEAAIMQKCHGLRYEGAAKKEERFIVLSSKKNIFNPQISDIGIDESGIPFVWSDIHGHEMWCKFDKMLLPTGEVKIIYRDGKPFIAPQKEQ